MRTSSTAITAVVVVGTGTSGFCAGAVFLSLALVLAGAVGAVAGGSLIVVSAIVVYV